MSHAVKTEHGATPLTTCSPSSLGPQLPEGKSLSHAFAKISAGQKLFSGNTLADVSRQPSRNVVGHFHASILPRGLRNLPDAMSLFDINKTSFFQLPGISGRTSGGSTVEKIDFHSFCGPLTVGSLRIETTARVGQDIQSDRFECLSIDIGRVNNFSLKAGALSAHSFDNRTVSSHQELNSVAERLPRFKRITKRQSNTEMMSEMKKRVSGKACNCRNSRCLKLYCECFKVGGYCSGKCSCINCRNNPKYDTEREAHLGKLRLPSPDDSHIQSESRTNQLDTTSNDPKPTACRCRRSSCLKNYCECFANGRGCAESCYCRDCKNTEASALTTTKANRV
jgi:hypothetical protein